MPYCHAPRLYYRLPPLLFNSSYSSYPSSSPSTYPVYVSDSPHLSPQQPITAASAGTLSRLASSFIFCSSSHAMATKASTSTCFPDHTTRQSRTHAYAHLDARSRHVYTGITRMTRALYPIIHVYICSPDNHACARSRICVHVRALGPLSRARHRCHVLPLQSPRRVLG